MEWSGRWRVGRIFERSSDVTAREARQEASCRRSIEAVRVLPSLSYGEGVIGHDPGFQIARTVQKVYITDPLACQ